MEKNYQILMDYYKAMHKNPSCIAMAEMAGFPNPITGSTTTYVDLLKKGFHDHHLSTKQIYDFQSLFFQKATFIQSVLEQNPTVDDLNQLLSNSIDATRKDLFTKLTVRNAVKDRYPKEYDDTSIHSIFKANSGTIVLRSSLSNDISYKIQENVFSVLGKKGRKHAVQVILDKKETLKSEIIRDICKNYDTIYTLDPRACILEIGVTLPKIFAALDFNPDMHEINNFLRSLVADLKDELKLRDIPYITGNTVESTSLGKGQERIYYEIIQALAQQLPKEKTHIVVPKQMEQNGLIGMMECESDQMEFYREMVKWESYNKNHELEKQYSNLQDEHCRALNCYQKILSERQ